MDNGAQLGRMLGRKRRMVRTTPESGQRVQETKSQRDRAESLKSKESRESKARDRVQFRWRQVVRTGIPCPEPGHAGKPVGARDGRAEAGQFPRDWDRQTYGPHSRGVTGLGHGVEAPVGDGGTVGSHRTQVERCGQHLPHGC